MKKALVIVLVMALLSIMAVGGTLSYFTDTDGAANTMTVGNVNISQQNFSLFGNPMAGSAVKLLPAVITETIGNAIPKDEDGLWKDAAIQNEITKIVTVTNTGSEPAYVRTIFAFETGMIYKENSDEIYGYIHDVYIGINGTLEFLEEDGKPVIITIGQVQYALAVCTYEAPVLSGETTESSLRQFFLSPHADQAFYDMVDGSYDILVLSQAVQLASLEEKTAQEALDEAFCPITSANGATIAGWFDGVN